MYLAYMDESGNTGRTVDQSQPIHLIGCLLVEDVQVRPFEDALAVAASKHFGAAAMAPRFEFHGAHLLSGKGVFRGIPPAARIAAAKDIIAAAQAHAAAFGYTGVDKLKSHANDHPHRIAFQLMIENLQPWLAAKKSLGLIVADENQEVGQDLIDDFALFKEQYTTWGYKRVSVRNIIDSVHFVQSHNNRIMQACDVMTYLFMRGHHIYRLKQPQYEAASKPKDWYSWLRANITPSETATLALYDEVRKITSFRAKIWP